MRLRDLNWMDVERYLEGDDRIILITGATQQHAYLSLLTDILIPEKIADWVAEREGVLIAPPLNYGVSGLFAGYPGTISLSEETFAIVLTEVVNSLMQQGFNRFLVINGHSGNLMPPGLDDMMFEGLLRLTWYDWWRSEAARAFEDAHGQRIEHANWGENFPFNRVGPVPEGSKPNVNPADLEGGTPVREVLGDGSFGGRYAVEDAVVLQLFYAVADEVAQLVRALND